MVKSKTKKPAQIRYSPIPKLKLVEAKHTGRYLSHHHTSNLGILIVVLLFGFSLLMMSSKVNASQQTGQGIVNVAAIVPGPAPSVGAIITTPENGITYHQSRLLVSGSCAPDTFVRIFKNQVLAGQTICSTTGRFSLTIELFVGRNDLTALNYDILDQAGPTTPAVTVIYKQINDNTIVLQDKKPIDQLYISTDYFLHGIKINQEIKWPIKITGGQAPYAILIDWGDSTTNLISANKNGEIILKHTYSQPGRFHIIVKVSDNNGQTGYLEFVAQVDGPLITAGGFTSASNSDTEGLLQSILKLAPYYWGFTALLAAFSLGDWYTIFQLKRARKLIP